MLFKNTWAMYEMINKVDKVEFKMLGYLMCWSEKKTNRHLKKLIKDGIVKEDNGMYYPTPVKELINWEEWNK